MASGNSASASQPASAFDPIAREVMREQHAPGMALCVIQHGRTVASRAYGIADLENSVPVTRLTEFPLASISKQLAAVAVLRLVGSGAVGLDDEVSRFVPEYHQTGVTIRRLLNHTAGIPSITELDRYWKQTASRVTPKELLEVFATEPLDFVPGTAYHYSSSGYVLLAMVVERASDEPYASYVTHRILEPLGLNRIVSGATSTLIANRAHGYRTDAGRYANAAAFDFSQGLGCADFLSTAEDLARWTVALHSGRVLPKDSYARMITPERLPNGEELTYGYGVELGTLGGSRLLSHAGGAVGFNSQAIYIPAEDLAIAVLSNSHAGFASLEMADRIMKRMLKLLGPSDLPLPASAQRYVGRYRMGKELVEITRQDAHLAVKYGESPVVRLRYQGDGVFAQDGRLARIHFRENGEGVDGFVLARYGSVLASAARER